MTDRAEVVYEELKQYMSGRGEGFWRTIEELRLVSLEVFGFGLPCTGEEIRKAVARMMEEGLVMELVGESGTPYRYTFKKPVPPLTEGSVRHGVKPVPPPGRILGEGEQPDGYRYPGDWPKMEHPMKDKGVWLYRAHAYMCVRFTVPRYTIALMAVLGTCLGLAICGSIWPH